MSEISKVLIIDNGAHSIKVGFSTDPKPIVIPNCVVKVKSERRRPFIGDQLEECRDYSGIYYIVPFEKGYLVNWEVQLQVWDYIFRTKMNLVPDGKNRLSHIALIITEPAYNFTLIREYMLRYLFEEYGFGKILISSAPQLASVKYFYEVNKVRSILATKKEKIKIKQSKKFACLVVDSGYSFSHVIPFIEGNKITKHMKRINIGGKALTNHLKDIISYRQVNVLEETYVVNQMKEDCCFVSTQFWNDLKIAASKPPENKFSRDYILPDYVDFRRGLIYDPDKHKDLINSEHQRIRLNNERFQVPELLFNPSDVNIDQIGISNTIIHSINEFHSRFAEKKSNILINPFELYEEVAKQVKVEKSKYVDESEEDEEEEGDEEEVEEEKPQPKKKSKKSLKKKKDDEEKQENEEPKIIDPSIYDNENIQTHLYDSILLIGGNCRFPNFRDRVYNDVRSSVPDFLELNVTLPDDPISYAWSGGQVLASVDSNGDKTTLGNCNNLLNKLAVTQKEYRQNGLTQCFYKFDHSQFPTF